MKKISIQGYKGLGKDTLAFYINDKTDEPKYKRFAFGDILKKLTIDKTQEYYNDIKEKFDFDYLKKDIIDFKNNIENIKEKLYDNIDNDNKEKIETFIHLPEELLNENDYLYLIEYFKNIPELRTRTHIQIYSNFIKDLSNDIGYFSNSLIKEMDNSGYDKKINTDNRFLIEAIDLLLNDFILFKLKNKKINENLKDKLHLQHFSEIELALNPNDIGLIIDTYDKNNDKDVYNRKNIDDIYKIYKNHINKYKSFKGYSKNAKKKLNKIKENLKKDTYYQDLLSKHGNLYHEFYNKNNKKVENDMKIIYENFVNHIKPIINDINNIIINDLNKINMKKHLTFKNKRI